MVKKAKTLPFFNTGENQVSIHGGSFLVDVIPKGFDTITLIRVLYDHDDGVVIELLKKVYDALPYNGQVVISEPMSGGKTPTRSGDSYFGFYTMAMSTGRPRSMKTHEAFLKKVGFQSVKKNFSTGDWIKLVNQKIIEIKGFKTDIYKLKLKLTKAVHPALKILEISAKDLRLEVSLLKQLQQLA